MHVTFLPDIACQKLLKSDNVSRSYSKNSTGAVILRHGVYLLGVRALTYLPLKPNTHGRRRRDETVESRRVGGVNTIRDDFRRIRSTILKLTKQTP